MRLAVSQNFAVSGIRQAIILGNVRPLMFHEGVEGVLVLHLAWLGRGRMGAVNAALARLTRP